MFLMFTCFIQRLFNSVLVTEFDIASPRKGGLATMLQSYAVFLLFIYLFGSTVVQGG